MTLPRLGPEERAALMLRRDAALKALAAGDLHPLDALLGVVAPPPKLLAASLAAAREKAA